MKALTAIKYTLFVSFPFIVAMLYGWLVNAPVCDTFRQPFYYPLTVAAWLYPAWLILVLLVTLPNE